MPEKKIICPYCFEEFNDDEVHFRMATVFSEDELDPKGYKRTLNEIEEDDRFKSDEIRAQMAEYNLRAQFQQREDEEYKKFWEKFGGTTEKKSGNREDLNVMPFNRPVLNPKNSQHKKFFKSDSEVINEGMLYAIKDCFGHETYRRVCPHCHNPLPGTYGKNPVIFYSVIGITGAGKTVYLSQLCKFIIKQLAYFGIVAVPTSIYPREYVVDNPVAMGKRLPVGTPPGQLLQPLCFDLEYSNRSNGQNEYMTIVFYDIAGENCVSSEQMREFGKFIKNSNGILLLIDPNQFSDREDVEQPVKVLETIHNVFVGEKELCELTIAICISKADKIEQVILRKKISDVEFLRDADGKFIPKFNAADYNPIHDSIKEYVEQNNTSLHVHLDVKYNNYNYFLFSAIGVPTKKVNQDGKTIADDDPNGFYVPAAPTENPKRIIEPIVWLLFKHGYIQSHGEINEPKDWVCKACGKRRRVSEKYCPVCKTNNLGDWKCPKCGTVNNVNNGRWCTVKKCNTDKDGKNKGLFTK